MSTRIIILISITYCSFLLTSCKQENASVDGEISQLEERYQENPSDSLLQDYLQALGREIRKASNGQEREVWIEKAIQTLQSPEKGYMKELFQTESLKNNPGGEHAADYLWALAEMKAVRNQMDEASLLFLGFKERSPQDARNREGEKYIFASQRNRRAFLKSLDHDMVVASDKGPDSLMTQQYIALSEAHALAFPASAETPPFLFKAAGWANATGNQAKSLQLYDWICTYFPGYPQAKESLMMKGFLLDTAFGLKAEAKEVYIKFLKQYPKDSLADDAKYLLENQGK